jgi:glycosyltransferase involved in cell wall biosynthesis
VNGAIGDNFRLVVQSFLKFGDYTIKVLTNQETGMSGGGKLEVCPIRFRRENVFDFINPISYIRIYKYIKFSKYDKILILSPHPVNMFITKFIHLQKTYFYLHDNEPHSGFPKLDLFFFSRQLDFIYKSKAHIIVSSNFMKEDILKRRPYVDIHRISVIYLGALENLQYSFEDNDTSQTDILFFGRLEYYKGLDILFDANKYTKGTYNYIIIAKGDLLATFCLKELPQNFIHINRYVSDKELARYINTSKIVVMPYRDATGTQVIQTAFFYEKPIVASNVGCFAEYITDGVDGIIVKKEDSQELAKALDWLMDNDQIRRAMGHRGKEKLGSMFSNRKILDQYIELLDDKPKKRT